MNLTKRPHLVKPRSNVPTRNSTLLPPNQLPAARASGPSSLVKLQPGQVLSHRLWAADLHSATRPGHWIKRSKPMPTNLNNYARDCNTLFVYMGYSREPNVAVLTQERPCTTTPSHCSHRRTLPHQPDLCRPGLAHRIHVPSP